jgi:hypothetical protein
MSKYNNVNPDHYKVAGRERPGKTAEVARNKVHSTEQEERERWAARRTQPEAGRQEPEGSGGQPEGRGQGKQKSEERGRE